LSSEIDLGRAAPTNKRGGKAVNFAKPPELLGKQS